MPTKTGVVLYNRDGGDECFRSLLTPLSARTEFGWFLFLIELKHLDAPCPSAKTKLIGLGGKRKYGSWEPGLLPLEAM